MRRHRGCWARSTIMSMIAIDLWGPLEDVGCGYLVLLHCQGFGAWDCGAGLCEKRTGELDWVERCSTNSCVDLLWMWQALHILACSLLRISEHCSSNEMGRMQRMRPVVKRPQWMASEPMDEARMYGPEILGFQVLSARRLCQRGNLLISSDFRFHTRTFQYWAVSILSILQWLCAEAVVLCPCLASRKVLAVGRARWQCECTSSVPPAGPFRTFQACWLWAGRATQKQRMGIALAAQPAQDAQTVYTAATTAQKTRSFKKATGRWWVHTRGERGI